MQYQFLQKVLFKHCDPAGIVFYPRYFEMINDAVEAMFDDLFEWPFEQILRVGGVPTVSFKVDFKLPSRHGEHLELNLTIQHMGQSSMEIQTIATGDNEIRMVADQVIVLVGLDGQPMSWPASLLDMTDSLMETPK
ncbi:acyl-CoA thioesterase [bacterium]|nr:acyl-CoA thioesterase [bacterium]